MKNTPKLWLSSLCWVSRAMLPRLRAAASESSSGGYLVTVEKGESSATMHILQAPEERNPWNVKLFAHTGFTPEKGKGYRISFDVEAAKPHSAFEVFYDGDSESAYGQLTGTSLKAGQNSVSYILQPGDSKGLTYHRLNVKEEADLYLHRQNKHQIHNSHRV